MLKTADYLEKAIRAEVIAQQAATPTVRECFADVARAWRRLAETAYRLDAAPAEGAPAC
jgi:hypothetical protein